MDEVDYKIVSILRENSRIQWKEIGEQIHLTGQAVGNRIRRMEDEGVIQKYSIVVDEQKLGNQIQVFITVFMKSTNHTGFQRLMKESEMIKEAHRISGEGCYLLKGSFATHEELNQFLERILQFGNYRVNMSIGKLKE